jgi:Protein of unknown function (DUF3467)
MSNEIDLGEMETVSVHPPEERQKERDLPILYANQVYMASTPWDIQMIFGRIQGLGVGKAETEQLVNIVMSPAHAKVMSQILSRQVAIYEAQYGPIVVKLPAAGETQAETEPESKQTKPALKGRSRKKLT